MEDQNESVVDQQNSAADTAKSEKLYTEAEVDALIKARIDKQNAKHGNETKTLEDRIHELEEANAKAARDREEMEERERIAAAKASISAELGVRAEILRGTTEEEIRAHAEAIKAAFPVAPSFRDSGNPAPSASVTKESILAIKNEKERLRAIEAHIELF